MIALARIRRAGKALKSRHATVTIPALSLEIGCDEAELGEYIDGIDGLRDELGVEDVAANPAEPVKHTKPAPAPRRSISKAEIKILRKFPWEEVAKRYRESDRSSVRAIAPFQIMRAMAAMLHVHDLKRDDVVAYFDMSRDLANRFLSAYLEMQVKLPRDVRRLFDTQQPPFYHLTLGDALDILALKSRKERISTAYDYFERRKKGNGILWSAGRPDPRVEGSKLFVRS